jgi:membrane fusion protein (multidrug efflux system)
MLLKVIKNTAILLLMIMMIACSSEQVEETNNNGKAISVKVMVLKTGSIDIMKTYAGSLEGEKQAVIYSKIAEAVSNVNVSVGQTVSKNQVLIELDESGPSSNLQEAYSLYKNSEKNFNKMEFLFKEGAVSETDFDAAKTDYEVKKATYESASKLVKIETPIDGLVTFLGVSNGDFVQVGQKLAEVASSDKVRIKFGVNASEINDINVGDQISINTESANNKIIGKVISVASSADPQTRDFEVEGLIDNKNNNLKPGMFVDVEHTQKHLKDVILIPRKAVIEMNNGDMVFVINNGIAVSIDVELGQNVNGLVVVKSGLNINDTLVTLGQSYLEDSSKVNITSMEN